jgi:hypothetical protein
VASCALTDDDLEILERIALPVDRRSQATDAVMQHLAGYPELRALVESNTTMSALRASVHDYVDSLFSGWFDDERLDGLLRIGVAHDRIGLPFTVYLGASLALGTAIVPGMLTQLQSRPELLEATIRAYMRLIACDFGIVAQTTLEVRDRITQEVQDPPPQRPSRAGRVAGQRTCATAISVRR